METYSNGGGDVLDKKDALELQDKEVQEIMNLVKDGVHHITRDGPVAFRAHGGDYTLCSKRLSCEFYCGGSYTLLSERASKATHKPG